jgi:hypothetical protein
VFAVLSRLLEGGASAVGRDSFSAHADVHVVGLGLRASHDAVGFGLFEDHVLDDLALLVVETSEKSPRTQETTKTTVRER